MTTAKIDGKVDPAIHSLDHFCFSVPRLADARNFYKEFGLDVRETDGGIDLYAFGNPHRWGIVRPSSRKKLEYLSFGIYAEDLDLFCKRIADMKIELMSAPPGGSDEGLWFRSPDGLALQLRVAAKTSPDEKAQFDVRSVGPGECAAIERSRAPRVFPRRLSHFMIFSSDVRRDLAFYQTVLGLRLSDHAGGSVAFMHGAHGSDHHLLALALSQGPGMHHSSWDVGTIQEVGLGGMHMAEHGFDKGWGLGQHVLGANYFQYVRDPWGSYAEYSCDIDYIPAGHEWPAADHPLGDALYLWGPPVPEDFVTNFEVTYV